MLSPLSPCLSLSLCLSLCFPSLSLCLSLSVYLSICLCLSVCLCLSLCLSLSLSPCLFLCLSVSGSLCLSLSVSVSLSLSVSLSIWNQCISCVFIFIHSCSSMVVVKLLCEGNRRERKRYHEIVCFIIFNFNISLPNPEMLVCALWICTSAKKSTHCKSMVKLCSLPNAN